MNWGLSGATQQQKSNQNANDESPLSVPAPHTRSRWKSAARGAQTDVQHVLDAAGGEDVGDVALVHGPAAEDEGRGGDERVQRRRHVLAQAQHLGARVLLGRHAGGNDDRRAARGRRDARARAAD